MQYEIGQFVQLNGNGTGVIVALPFTNESRLPEDHLGVWFGNCNEFGAPIICTVPTEYFVAAKPLVSQH